MNAQQARAIVKATFPQAFDKGRFHNFAINLLNHIDESKAQMWNTTYIKDAFKDHVKGYECLGTYTSPDKDKLDVLIVHLRTESKLERARAAIRTFVADYLKTRDNKDAALVAFVSRRGIRRQESQHRRLCQEAHGADCLSLLPAKERLAGRAQGRRLGRWSAQFFPPAFRRHIRRLQKLFNDILEPLFYDTLATDLGHDAWCKIFNCRIPFLNGGLFEPLRDYDWRKTDTALLLRHLTRAGTASGLTGYP